MPRPLWSQANTRTVIELQATSRTLLSGDFKALPAPDPLNPILPHSPAAYLQQRRDPTVTVAAIFGGKSDNGSGERILVSTNRGNITLCSLRLADDPAGMTF